MFNNRLKLFKTGTDVHAEMTIPAPNAMVTLRGRGEISKAKDAILEAFSETGREIDPDHPGVYKQAGNVAARHAIAQVEDALGYFDIGEVVGDDVSSRAAALFQALGADDPEKRADAKSRIDAIKDAASRGNHDAADLDYAIRRMASAALARRMVKNYHTIVSEDTHLGGPFDFISDIGSAVNDAVSTVSGAVQQAQNIAQGAQSLIANAGKVVGGGAGAILQNFLPKQTPSDGPKQLPPPMPIPSPNASPASTPGASALLGPQISNAIATLQSALGGNKAAAQQITNAKALAEAGVPAAQKQVDDLKTAQNVMNKMEAAATQGIDPGKALKPLVKKTSPIPGVETGATHFNLLASAMSGKSPDELDAYHVGLYYPGPGIVSSKKA